jgi:hypothetical protein
MLTPYFCLSTVQGSTGKLSLTGFQPIGIGGGINGFVTARDAACRGLKVAVIEVGDFGSGPRFAPQS